MNLEDTVLSKTCQSKQGSSIPLYEVHRIDKSKAQKTGKMVTRDRRDKGVESWYMV